MIGRRISEYPHHFDAVAGSFQRTGLIRVEPKNLGAVGTYPTDSPRRLHVFATQSSVIERERMAKRTE
ncbi:hypothetical protein BVIET440_290009 [Burkholderia vietnamiensis]|nr:hypothetical protein BVI2075_230086 [Burkholderia vietnamiensis]